MRFNLEHTDGKARAGSIETAHSRIDTPAFMPCATMGALRAVRWNEVEDLGFKMVLMNALHLHLRPGEDVIHELGGLHEFTSWKKSILTDSGGYQFFSLKGLYAIDDDGVSFQSPYDGSSHRFTPESVIDLQVKLRSDIMMPLDHCAPGDASRDMIIEAGDRTIAWLKRAKIHFGKADDGSQALFGIVQGGVEADLRKKYAGESSALDLPGYAIGGISVGEEREEGSEIVHLTAPLLPSEKPRYLMGVGLPEQILDGIAAGVDLFDCVLPTRMARNGTLFTSDGRLNLKNSQYRNDPKPLDENCLCPTCARYSRAYLAHSYKSGEPGVLGLLSIHNIAYYIRLVTEAREAILTDRFDSWRSSAHDRWH